MGSIDESIRDAEDAAMLLVLERAKRGCYESRTQVTKYVFRRYRSRVDHIYFKDSTIERCDLHNEFYLGIWEFIPRVDHRGDALYHLSQRGVWRVESLVRTALRRRTTGTDHDGEPVHVSSLDGAVEIIPDPEQPFYEVTVNSLAAKQRIMKIHSSIVLSPSCERLFDWMVESGVDPTEKGFVNSAAKHLGVSPQRVSQMMNKIREAAHQVEE